MRIAEGAGMNMLGKKFTDSKIVTHGINFDVNKAVIKPESMGTLNGIVQIMTDNPDVKFEVGGHTDSDGDVALNLKLSQARADAVRTQLISMGIDASRLTAKGYGKSKPISDNTSPEGKANNRRVEFVKK
jgi:outer membrane protein OmpA-like peptidoglycan-associated protein